MLEPEKWLQVNAHLSDPGQRLRAACASHMDDAIGQILAVLDRKKLRDKRWCCFLATTAHIRRPTIRAGLSGQYEQAEGRQQQRSLRGLQERRL